MMTNVRRAYRLFDEPRPADDLGCWESVVGEFTQVAGYTFFGDFFLREPGTGYYAVLCTLRPELIPLSYREREAFEQFLATERVQNHLLRVKDVEELERMIGAPGRDEVYVPEPYPFLGGDESLESYARRNVWVFVDLVGQVQGIGAGDDADDAA